VSHAPLRLPRPLAALLLAAVLAACSSPAPSTSPVVAAPSGSFADRLRAAVSVDAIMADLGQLQAIADDHDGIRAAGTPGYDASAGFVAQTLRDLGYQVSLDSFTLPLFSEVGDGLIGIPGGPAFTAGTDFRAMLFSASGDVTARVTAVGFNRAADPVAFAQHSLGTGCAASDLPAAVRGTILLVQPGPCYRRAQAEAAQEAGALAIVIAYPQWEPGYVLRPTLLTPDGITIPVIGATREVGLALDDAAGAAASVHLRMTTAVVDRPVASVIADSPGGDPSQVVMLGGHLDSVLDGPGIQDNGSGTMTILEIARRLASVGTPRLRVRFAFWAGEEIGLYGSQHYVRNLSGADRSAIQVYLNFDMLGSPNGARLVYEDAGAASGSDQVTSLFASTLRAEGLTSGTIDVSGASDHYSFEQAGIPTGGLFSGANEIKTSIDAQTYGGTSGALFDACYHRPCDTIDNVDPVLLEQMARTAAYVTGLLAAGEARVHG
jgi:Zn-dependent M28 family amino/carboxypeptidase